MLLCGQMGCVREVGVRPKHKGRILSHAGILLERSRLVTRSSGRFSCRELFPLDFQQVYNQLLLIIPQELVAVLDFWGALSACPRPWSLRGARTTRAF